MSTKSMSDSLENQKSGFGFGEYAETVGPQGLLFVLKGIVFYFTFEVSLNKSNFFSKSRKTRKIGKTPRWRKLMWLAIICVGIIYSSYNIKLCAVRYYSYPSTIKPAKNANGLVRFPKVLACLNVSFFKVFNVFISFC